MTLYNYTAPTTSHLGSILAEGTIRTTESNLSFSVPHAGPDVVWLTDSRDPAGQAWTAGPYKSLAVFVVELPVGRVDHWPAWSRDQGIDETTYLGLAESGGDPERWWVATRPVNKWSIRSLTIAPFEYKGTKFELREFSGDELSRLFRSSGARKQLNLPVTKTRQTALEGDA